MKPILALALTTLAVTLKPCQAQDATARGALTGLQPRLHVRLQFRGGSVETGRLALVGDTVQLYSAIDGWHRFGVDSVTAVWRERPGSAERRARTGAITGAVLLGLAAFTVTSGFCGDPDSGGCSAWQVAEGAGFGALLGAAIGTILGWFAGAAFPVWQLVFPAP